MKKAFNSILAIMLALIMSASIVASEITVTPELSLENDTEITVHEDEDREPDCSPNYDESWLDICGGDY